MFYIFQAVTPPIIRSLKLYIQHRVLVKSLLLPATFVEELEPDVLRMFPLLRPMFTNFIPVKVIVPLSPKHAASRPSFAQSAFSLAPTPSYVFQVHVHIDITYCLSVGLQHYVEYIIINEISIPDLCRSIYLVSEPLGTLFELRMLYSME
jgi:hypothetical protein